MEGTSERTTVEKIYNYHIYTENIIKSFIYDIIRDTYESNGRGGRENDSRENLQLSHIYHQHHKTFYVTYIIR
jgi:hypothetical protein